MGMVSNTDPEKLQSDLSAFRESQSDSAQRLDNVLQDYTKLIEAYRDLKSDYEEARDSREKYKKIAKECVRQSPAMDGAIVLC
jgi:DNA-binding ferritin-like protein